MAYIKSKDGLNIHYGYIQGKKGMPILFFVHGWAVDWTFFKDMIGFFQKKGYGVLYLDLRGHGKTDSPKNLAQSDLNLIVGDLRDILRKEKVGKVILIGHSMGGMVSFLFTLKYQKMVEKLIVMNSYYKSPLKSSLMKFMNEDVELAKKITSKVLEKTKTKKDKDELDYSKMKRSFDLNIFVKAMKSTSVHDSFLFINSMLEYDIEKKLKDIKVPTLITNSTKDQFFSVRSSQKMASMIPNAVCRIFEGTHSLPMKKFELLSKEIELFIR